MTALSIWLTAGVAYAIFWCWYVGFKKPVTTEEAEAMVATLDARAQWTSRQREALRHFLGNDDGKDFVMVNLLHLQSPRAEARRKLDIYQKIFLGGLLRRAGHPVLVATAASGNIENLNCHEADDWSAAGMIRYRSRRDLMEVLPATVGSEHHHLKLEALEKTLAFPASPWFMLGGPRVVVALALALLAALIQIGLGA